MTKRRSMIVGLWAALFACALLLVGPGAPALAETLADGEAEPVIGESATLNAEDDELPAPDEYAPTRVNALSADESAGVSTMSADSGTTKDGLEWQIMSDGTLYITGYSGESKSVKIPASINGHEVKVIGSYAFDGKGLTSVTLPSTLEKIQNCAFAGNSFSSIQLPEGLKELGQRAFWSCNNLTTLNIPASLEPMDYSVRTSVTPSGESYVRDYYYNPVVACERFTGFTVSSGNANYKAVNSVLFSKDGSILYSWPYGRNVGGSYAVPQGTKVIADEAFAAVSGLRSISFPNSLEKICDSAFYGTDLTSVFLPDSVTEVQSSAFQNCKSLASVRLSSGMRKVYELTFVNCSKLASVTNTRGIQEIGWRAFAAYGSPLSSFEFGDNMTFIATEAFLETKVGESSYPSYLSRTGSGNYAITDTLVVSAQQNYNYAREVLNLVNQERAKVGAPALSLDADLTTAAMQRAAEISLLFEHMRPDGSDCFSISSKASGENIAAGSSTPAAVMKQWMNSSGHRSNILNNRWGSMGIGCVKVGSVTYWVQLFSDDGPSGSVPSGTRTQKATLTVVNSVVPFADGNSGFNLNMRQGNPEPLVVGGTYSLEVGVINPGWSSTYCSTDASGFTWKSSNGAVVTVGSNGVVRAVGTGTATVSATSRAGYTWTKTFKVTAPSSGGSGGSTSKPSGGSGNTGGGTSKPSTGSGSQQQAVKTVTMHRLYNRYTGEHFYTASATERDSLVKVGWTSEGVGWVAPTKSKTPVYRLYNPYVRGGDHHYTASASERDALVKAGWRYEGIGWYSDDAKGAPLYRQYNPYAATGTHNYTASKNENDTLVRLGWRAEGIGWYGVK